MNQPVLFPECEVPVQESFPLSSGERFSPICAREGAELRDKLANAAQASPLESSPSRGLARNSDPETAHLAANSVDVNGLQLKVLEVLRANKLGLTAEELADRLRLPLNSISPRTRPMVAKGLIYDSGIRRETSSRRQAIVWRAYV